MEVLIKEITSAYMPEFIIILFILLNMIVSVFTNKNHYRFSKGLSLLGVALALCSTFYADPDQYLTVFKNEYLFSIYTLFFKILILICAFFIILLSRNLIRTKKEHAYEYFTLLLSGVLFSMCTISVTDFTGLLVCLGSLLLSSYLLIAYSKNPNSKQLSFGYLIIGGVALSLFLLGVAYIYGLSSELNFWQISEYFTNNPPQVLLTFSLLLITCIIWFNLGVVPFSSWLPDTFEGANYPVAAYLSAIPPLACFGILARLLMVLMPFTTSLRLTFAIIAVLTIIFGSLCAIRQNNIKRLMAYSMSVQSGIILLGLCVFSVYSLSSVLFYLFCYIFANIGAWSAIILFHNSTKKDAITDYQGLIYRRPYYVIAFTMVLISLAGIAPTCGFIGKLYIFSAVARSGFIFLPFLIIAMLASVIMIFSYWKIIRQMFRRVDTGLKIDTNIISSKFILYACALGTILCCIYADKIIQLAQLAAYYM